MKRHFVLLAIFAAMAFAGEGRAVYNPFSSFGLELGMFRPANDSWSDERSTFGNVDFISNIQLLPYTSFTGDVGYSFPGNGFIAKVGLQQQLLPTYVTPFVGGMAGIGAIPEDDRTDEIRDRFGPVVEANAGLFFFRESFFSVRLKGFYQWTFAKEVEHGYGLSLGILFANSRPGLKAIDVSR